MTYVPNQTESGKAFEYALSVPLYANTNKDFMKRQSTDTFQVELSTVKLPVPLFI